MWVRAPWRSTSRSALALPYERLGSRSCHHPLLSPAVFSFSSTAPSLMNCADLREQRKPREATTSDQGNCSMLVSLCLVFRCIADYYKVL